MILKFVGLSVVVSLKLILKGSCKFYNCSLLFHSEDCSHKGARVTEEERKKKRKMTKVDFHRFQIRHFSNAFE